MKKKRYILFGFYNYYPSGGMNDAIESFDEKEEILNDVEQYNSFGYDYYQIFDTETFRTRKSSSLEDILIE